MNLRANLACGGLALFALLLGGCPVITPYLVETSHIAWSFDPEHPWLSIRVYPDWSRFLRRTADRPVYVGMSGAIAGRTIIYEIKANSCSGDAGLIEQFVVCARPVYPEAFILEGPAAPGVYLVVAIERRCCGDPERVVGIIDTSAGSGDLQPGRSGSEQLP